MKEFYIVVGHDEDGLPELAEYSGLGKSIDVIRELMTYGGYGDCDSITSCDEIDQEEVPDYLQDHDAAIDEMEEEMKGFGAIDGRLDPIEPGESFNIYLGGDIFFN